MAKAWLLHTRRYLQFSTDLPTGLGGKRYCVKCLRPQGLHRSRGSRSKMRVFGGSRSPETSPTFGRGIVSVAQCGIRLICFELADPKLIIRAVGMSQGGDS